MAQKIESDKLVIKDVFTKWYRIPEYQRPYVWDDEQILELLDDVMQAEEKNPDSEYFLGSLVLKKTVNENDSTTYEEFDLLDGQQRLTTLFLITAVIRDLTDNAQLKDICIKSISQEENQYDNIPERVRIVFDIREEVKKFVDTYIKATGGTDKIEALAKLAKEDEDLSIRNMANAVLTIRNYFAENDINKFFKYLRSKVLIIYVSADELEDAFRLFTIMNNRGVKLRTSDILKAENLSQVADHKQRQKYAKDWEQIESYFGEDFDTFLSHLRTILVKQKAAVGLLKEFEENIYNPSKYDKSTKIKTNIQPLLRKGIETFEFIIKYKQHYEDIFEKNHYSSADGYAINNYLTLMKKGFEADFWVPPLLRYYDKFDDKDLLDFIKLLDNKFANDWLTGYSPSKRIENANAIIDTIDKAESTQQVLESNSFNLDVEYLNNVLKGNVYGRRTARYILLKLDLLFLGKDVPFNLPETISVEHILPQTPSADSQWRVDFSDEEREALVNKLGNLVLISRRKNSAQGNRDYSDKKKKYFEKNIEVFSNSVRIFQNYPTWTLEDLKNNQEQVIQKISQGFRISP